MVFGEVSVLVVEPDGRDGCGGCGELCDAVGVAVGFYADEGLCGCPVRCWRYLSAS